MFCSNVTNGTLHHFLGWAIPHVTMVPVRLINSQTITRNVTTNWDNSLIMAWGSSGGREYASRRNEIMRNASMTSQVPTTLLPSPIDHSSHVPTTPSNESYVSTIDINNTQSPIGKHALSALLNSERIIATLPSTGRIKLTRKSTNLRQNIQKESPGKITVAGILNKDGNKAAMAGIQRTALARRKVISQGEITQARVSVTEDQRASICQMLAATRGTA